DITRLVTEAESTVVWASPYTGSVFAAPGTLYDAQTQNNLTRYLRGGGRLFVTGQDVIFALSNAGSRTNFFLQNELRASWAGEQGGEHLREFFYTLNGNSGDETIVNHDPSEAYFEEFFPEGLPDPPLTLHTPANFPLGAEEFNDTYADAAWNHMFNSFPEILKPVAAAGEDETITTLYSYSVGGVAAQRVEKRNRGSSTGGARGIESRVVFFAFGFEAINREYRELTIFEEPFWESRNFRSKIADNILHNYLTTGRVSGVVTNAATNRPIPNFLVQISPRSATDDGLNPIDERLFITRTDATGAYEFRGVPPGEYFVMPAAYTDATDPDNLVIRSLNGPYFTNIGLEITVRGGEAARNNNFRVNPSPPGNIIGRAISSESTATNIVTAPNLPVLIRSVNRLPATDNFPNGGIYSALIVTDAFGNFSFNNLPTPEVQYQIIFNPFKSDIPIGSGIDYDNPTSLIKRNRNFGRRALPLDNVFPRPPAVPDPIVAPVGATLNLGDIPVPAGADTQPTPDPGGTPGPTPVAGGQFAQGGTYQISVPYMQSSALTSLTTPSRAFTVPPVSNTGVQNYRLTRWDPLTLSYIVLDNSSLLKRGEGYFLRADNSGTSLKTPAQDPAQVVPLPASVNTFTITLKRNTSSTSTNNGFNLIGFPFNPAFYTTVDWTRSEFVIPGDPTRYTYAQAVSRGFVSRVLLTLKGSAIPLPPESPYNETTTMLPFTGYFAQTFVDGLQVILKASPPP
ncbi:MAG TPA: hypothetical protein VNA16_00775, partial [Abditibacteriaceae bacterium]|nr:hypothetical protein [Abditibacteriaceae bacterium]